MHVTTIETQGKLLWGPFMDDWPTNVPPGAHVALELPPGVSGPFGRFSANFGPLGEALLW